MLLVLLLVQDCPDRLKLKAGEKLCFERSQEITLQVEWSDKRDRFDQAVSVRFSYELTVVRLEPEIEFALEIRELKLSEKSRGVDKRWELPDKVGPLQGTLVCDPRGRVRKQTIKDWNYREAGCPWEDGFVNLCDLFFGIHSWDVDDGTLSGGPVLPEEPCRHWKSIVARKYGFDSLTRPQWRLNPVWEWTVTAPKERTLELSATLQDYTYLHDVRDGVLDIAEPEGKAAASVDVATGIIRAADMGSSFAFTVEEKGRKGSGRVTHKERVAQK
jgi:hypothetical protein